MVSLMSFSGTFYLASGVWFFVLFFVFLLLP